MSLTPPSRRDFIGWTSAAAAAMAVLPRISTAAPAPMPTPPWALGCHGRAFRRFRLSLDGLLDSIQAAGFTSAEIVMSESEAAGRPTTPESVAAIGRGLAVRKMTSRIEYLKLPKGGSHEDGVASIRRQIDYAHSLGQIQLQCQGVEHVRDWAPACRLLREGAAYGQDRGVTMTVKQHHGLNNTPLELLGWMKQVDHPNFGLVFDPGNLVYYTGKNPVEQLDLIAPHVVGLIAKDCTGPQYKECRSGDPGFGTHAPNPRGDEVMIQFGTGVVDLGAIIKKLDAAGFRGPVMIEGLTIGANPAETVANARANREYLERLLPRPA